MPTDIEGLRRDTSLAATAAQYGVSLQKDGDEWEACCPFHSENTPSFTIFTGNSGVEKYHCFGCGVSGDVLDFVGAIKGCDVGEAIRILGGETKRENVAPRQIVAKDIYAGITPLGIGSRRVEVGNRVKLFNPKRVGQRSEWGSFIPSAVYPYTRLDGSLIGYVLRHDLPDGGKETPMVMFVRLPNGDECWSRYPFPIPRPLYGLGDLRDGQVFIAEGEKCRDALAKATGFNFISWAGGTHGIKHADWSPIAGRSVVIWPDADDPGFKTAGDIADLLQPLNCRVRVMNVPREAA